jgi:hypothetical protein
VDYDYKARLQMTRRQMLGMASQGVGLAALGSLLAPTRLLAAMPQSAGGLEGLPHFPPKAKRVIFLFQAGAPSQIELFDYKPKLKELHGTELPDSVRKTLSLAGAAAVPDKFIVAAPSFEFSQHGQSGAWVSELLPHTARIVDDIAFIRSVQTEVPNHEPAMTFFQTGAIVGGRPSMGAWVNYALGSANQNVPAFVVLLCKTLLTNSSVTARYWGSGFMPSKYQGVALRPASDPVAYLSNPPGIDSSSQKEILDDLTQLNRMSYETYGDPEIESRSAQYEMAYRMQSSLPELADLSKEPDSVFELYGPDSRIPGTYAANCLLARRLAERDVRFIQLYQRGWDQHGNLPREIRIQSKLVDQASAALIQDLKQRGLLEDTLVIWAGEFGRTVYSQSVLTGSNYGRDHHGACFTVWMAGGGIKPGVTYGETDDFSFNVAHDPVPVHDLQATILHCLGIDHTRLTYKFQGRYFRLTDIAGEVVKKILV